MKPSNATRRAYGFVRLSTEEQAEEGRAGVLRQRHDIELAAKVHGLTIVKTLEAIGLSGTQVLGSPVFDELVRALPTIDGVIVSQVDRLVRPGYLGDPRGVRSISASWQADLDS
jgi:DNA invertase Pin-like site-specific DNA recombinase